MNYDKNINDEYLRISKLLPKNIIEYLKNTGWTKDLSKEQHDISIWRFNDKYKNYLIKVLENQEYDDYSLRTKEIVEQLAIVESRSISSICSDIENISKDIWKIHLREPTGSDGTLSLVKGVDVYEQIRNFFTAGASSANDIIVRKISPSIIYPNKKVSKVEEFQKQLVLEQTEIGSYVIAVSTKIQPIIQQRLDGISSIESFERNVNLTIVRAINKFQTLYSDRQNEPETAVQNILELSYSDGFNVNLCEAIANISKFNEVFTDLELECKWAKAYPVSPELSKPIVLKADEIKYISESAKQYRENNPLLNYEVRGYVRVLERDRRDNDGSIVLVTKIENKKANLKIILSNSGQDSDYDKALSAHRNTKLLKCVGDLKKEGRSYVLLNPHDVEIIEFDESEDIE